MLRWHGNQIPLRLTAAFLSFALVMAFGSLAQAKKGKKKAKRDRGGDDVDMVIDADEVETEGASKKNGKKKSSDAAEKVDVKEAESKAEEDAGEAEDDIAIEKDDVAAEAEESDEENNDDEEEKDEKDDGDEEDDEEGDEDGDEEEGEVEEVADIAVEASSEGGGILATTFESQATARRDRGVNILTAHATRKGSLTLVVDHRPFKNLFSGEDAFFDYLGLDRGESLKLGLGLRYGIIDGLDFGIYRLNDGGTVLYDTYEFDLRYAFLNQERFFVNLMARAGLSWFVQEDASDAVGYFGQLFVDRIFFDTLLVGAGFAFHSESSSPYKKNEEDGYSGAITGVIEWRALNWLAVTGEIAAAVFGYKQDYPAGTFALKFLTHRHTFSIMLSNTQYINADGIVSNAWRGGKELIFGFQIFREFEIADY